MLQLVLEMGREAQRTGAWDEALAHYETALAMIPADGDAKSRADLLRWTGTVHAERGCLDEAVESLRASRDVAEAAGRREEIAAAQLCLANVELLRGNLDEAAEVFLRARELSEEAGQDRLVAQIDQNLGTIANIQGNVAMALLSYRSALERYRKLGDEATVMRALNNMGMAHVDLGEWEAAESCLSEAAAIASATGDAIVGGKVELNTAELHIKRRRYPEATTCIERSLEVFHRLRIQPGVAEAYKFQGIVYRETGRAGQAETHFALSLEMAKSCQDRLLQAETQVEWAILHLEEERKQTGVVYMNRALQLFQGLRANREVLDIERRMDRLKEMYLPAVRGWGAQLTEEKDPYQVGHAQRVADYATKLAREAGVEGWDLTYLRIGAFIHDLGNMAVPADVLNKADALDNKERELMKVHTIMGESMVRQLDFPEPVRPVVRSHHEEWAGGGYPDRLVGEEIPFGARVVAIADVYDTLTSPRSFREAHTTDAAIRIMEKDALRMFDPNLFGTFTDMIRRGGMEG